MLTIYKMHRKCFEIIQSQNMFIILVHTIRNELTEKIHLILDITFVDIIHKTDLSSFMYVIK